MKRLKIILLFLFAVHFGLNGSVLEHARTLPVTELP